MPLFRGLTWKWCQQVAVTLRRDQLGYLARGNALLGSDGLSLPPTHMCMNPALSRDLGTRPAYPNCCSSGRQREREQLVCRMADLPTTAPAEKVVCGGGRAPLAEANARSVAFFDADLTPLLTFVWTTAVVVLQTRMALETAR